jgi:hypothetical protein
MECPTCGEKRIKWANKKWDAADKDFWVEGTIVAFLCYGKYEITKEGYKVINPCKADKRVL